MSLLHGTTGNRTSESASTAKTNKRTEDFLKTLELSDFDGEVASIIYSKFLQQLCKYYRYSERRERQTEKESE